MMQHIADGADLFKDFGITGDRCYIKTPILLLDPAFALLFKEGYTFLLVNGLKKFIAALGRDAVSVRMNVQLLPV